jgi:hypothetical protein
VRALHRGTAACKSGQRCDGDHLPRCSHTSRTHTTMTCGVSGRFRDGEPFDKVVSRISRPSPF